VYVGTLNRQEHVIATLRLLFARRAKGKRKLVLRRFFDIWAKMRRFGQLMECSVRTLLTISFVQSTAAHSVEITKTDTGIGPQNHRGMIKVLFVYGSVKSTTQMLFPVNTSAVFQRTTADNADTLVANMDCPNLPQWIQARNESATAT
jgi:hypothetical protein